MTRFLVLLMAMFAVTIAGCENSGSRRSAGDAGSASRDTDSSPKADWGNEGDDNTDGTVSVDGTVDGTSDGVVTDGSEGTDDGTDGSDDGTDATDGECVPPPEYYEGKEYTCENVTGTHMLIRSKKHVGWDVVRAPYGDLTAFAGLPCDPTEALAYLKCTCEE